jgi:8-oxo-dGTP diphosphatase
MTAPDFTATLPTKRTAAGLLFTDPAGRVLLVEPTYKDVWEIPGGSVERDESPRAAAAREAREELGLALTPGRLLVVDWVPPRGARTDGVMFVFAGGRLDTEAIRLPADELRSWAWCTPEEAATRLTVPMTRRILAARAALTDGTTVYLEDGHQ